MKTNYQKIIEKNLTQIVKMKVQLVNDNQFVVLMPDGEIRVKEHSDHFTTGPVATFGGPAKNESQAKKQLTELINLYDGNLYENELKNYL